jgi:hypothetical protein
VVDEYIFVSCEVPVAFKLVVLIVPTFSVWIFAVAMLEVEALVVEALLVAKLDVVPQRVEMIAEVICAKIDNRPVEVVVPEMLALEAAMFPVDVRFDTVVEASVDEPLTVRLVEARLEVVALVIVPLVITPPFADRLVITDVEA